jgi:hypothetical protein
LTIHNDDRCSCARFFSGQDHIRCDTRVSMRVSFIRAEETNAYVPSNCVLAVGDVSGCAPAATPKLPARHGATRIEHKPGQNLVCKIWNLLPLGLESEAEFTTHQRSPSFLAPGTAPPEDRRLLRRRAQIAGRFVSGDPQRPENAVDVSGYHRAPRRGPIGARS